MKKIININLSSRLIPIEDTAYELLKSYLESLKRYFSREEGGEEIVSDIEDRVAELFQEKLKKGAHCITDEDVHAMILVMGRPEQLEEETTTEPEEKHIPGQETPPPSPEPKRLVRNANDKMLGGVCSGIAAYFNIDPAVVRIITFLLIWAWGFGVILYIILWIVLPSSKTVRNPLKRRLYRNPDNKVIGGVCSGIASYLNIDPVIPRVIFVLPLLGVIFTSIFRHDWFMFSGFFFPLSVGALPTLIVLYIILWIAIPKAVTVTEKLEMRGEKIDVHSISHARKESSSEEKKNEVEPEAGEATIPYPQETRRHNTGLGEILLGIFKIFAYFILAVIVIAICIALIGIAGGFIGAATFSSVMIPYKGLVLSSPLQHILAWPAVLLTLGIPVVAIIWLLIKLITGFRPRTRHVGLTLFLLWIVGLICAVWLCISIGRDFRMHFNKTQELTIQQPSSSRLILSKMPSNISFGGWDGIDHFIQVNDDTVILKTIGLDILKSEDSSFHIKMMYGANGPTVHQARKYAEEIHLTVRQQDSVFFISDGFAIPKGWPFRNQHVMLKVYVPEGKQIRVEEDLDNFKYRWHNSGRWHDWDDWDDYENDWDYDKDYLMTPDGLKSKEDLQYRNQESEPQNSDTDSVYRYKQV